VLKPLDCAEREISWQAELFASIEQEGFRVAGPLPDVVDGWTATPYLDGRHEQGRWRDIIAVGERFHAAFAGVPRPDAIIDFAPYWRPAEYATAIIATDTVLWENAPEDLLTEAKPQYLLRALIYRGVTRLEFGTDDWRPTFELARRIA
jgi:hypothetical protein